MAFKNKNSDAKSSPESRDNEAESNRHHPPASVQPVEHDARQTGGSPNRQRGAVRANTEEGAGEQQPELPAAQHATGSFTGEGGVRDRKRIGRR